jgi:DDE superfamily endonuclease
MCTQRGVRLIYLPPYSPDFNPIELSFSPLKAWMRAHRELANEFSEWFEGFFHLAVQQCGVERHAKEYFRHCFFAINENTVDVPYHTIEELPS